MINPDELPTVVFTANPGRYRAEFDYDPAVVGVLKAAVPGPMRRWRPRIGCWEVSADWVGPLTSALLEAGVVVRGLTQANIADWFGVFADEPGPADHDAYRAGRCVRCGVAPHRPGSTECDACYRRRLIRQRRLIAALIHAGAIGYPRAHSSAGRPRYPLPIDWVAVECDGRDHTEVVDLLLAGCADDPVCPICGRRTPKDKPAHGTCRARLLRALAGRPFTKAGNKAFQAGLCTVCRTRPHLILRRSTCGHCAEIVDTCRSLRVPEASP
jgi:hypothetical protein